MTTKIEWTHRPGTTGVTWNPITGCTKISEGCRNCYAERMSKRLAGRFGYPADDPFAVTAHFDKFDEPFKWSKPRTVFVCSMGDLFHDDVGFNVHQHIWDVMEATPRHTYLLLTKRPDHLLDTLDELCVSHGVLPNVWLGVTVESNKQRDRILTLKECPAAVRFVSYEPALGPLDIPMTWYSERHIDHPDFAMANKHRLRGIDWLIVGGETGPGARVMDPHWAWQVRDQCQAAGVPFFFKQMSAKVAIPDDLMIREWPEAQQ